MSWPGVHDDEPDSPDVVPSRSDRWLIAATCGLFFVLAGADAVREIVSSPPSRGCGDSPDGGDGIALAMLAEAVFGLLAVCGWHGRPPGGPVWPVGLIAVAVAAVLVTRVLIALATDC